MAHFYYQLVINAAAWRGDMPVSAFELLRIVLRGRTKGITGFPGVSGRNDRDTDELAGSDRVGRSGSWAKFSAMRLASSWVSTPA
jgi:hypothetical protein